MKHLLITLLLFLSSIMIKGQINLATDGSKATASAAEPGGPVADAFDANTGTGWMVFTSPVQWLQYDFESPVVIDGYIMHYVTTMALEFQPADWILSGSDNATDWTPVDTVTNDPLSFIWEEFISTNTTAYRYYRFDITASGNDSLAIGELQMYQITLPTVITGETNYIEAELAACSGNVTKSGGTPILTRGICYNTTGDPTLVDSYRYSSAGIGSFNVTIPNLTPNTTYYFRAFATNSKGVAYAPVVKTFTTLKLDQSITFPALLQKTYGDPVFTPVADASSGLDVQFSSSDTSVAKITGNQVQIVGAGSTVITAMQPGDTIYYAATPVNRTLTIIKKELIATADDKEKHYGEANPEFTISYTGFAYDNDATSLSSEPTAYCLADEYSEVGTYFITLSNGSDNNYHFSYAAGILTVNKAILTAIAENKNKIYGDNNPEFTIQYSGFVNDDDINNINEIPTASSSADATSDVGTYAIMVSGGSDNNYTFEYTYGTLTILKADLAANAEDKEKTYGDPNPELTVSYSGFKNDDSASDLDITPSASTTADETSNSGMYEIVVSGGSDNNYSFVYSNGTLTISKAILSAQVTDTMRYVGEPNPEFEVLLTGFVNDDDVSDIDELPTATCDANESSPAGTYDIVISGGSDNNYDFDYSNGTLTVLEEINTVAQNKDLTITVYPNPASDLLYFRDNSIDDGEIELVNINGSILLKKTISNHSVSVAGIAPGIYMLGIYRKNERVCQHRIVIE
jgi:hypothetical protein